MRKHAADADVQRDPLRGAGSFRMSRYTMRPNGPVRRKRTAGFQAHGMANQTFVPTPLRPNRDSDPERELVDYRATILNY
jgi:hypothetical protein